MRSPIHSEKTRRLPVFVSPQELRFYGDDETTHKQIFTLFNPYTFKIGFKVSSTAPHKYSMAESHGTINARCCVDLAVCHRLASEGPYNVSDKFRIELFHDRRDISRPVGWKLIVSTLLKARTGSQGFEEFEDGMNDFVSPPPSMAPPLPATDRRVTRSGSSVLVIMAALLCLLVLRLPLEGEGEDWPAYLHLTFNQKLITAFALGSLLTLAILKS